MATPISVRGIGAIKHATDEYIITSIYFPGVTSQGQNVLAAVTHEIHLMDNLRAHLLLGNDIIGPESIKIDLVNGNAHIGSCGVDISINSKPRGQYVRRNVHAEITVVVPPRSQMMILVAPSSIPDDRDFFFEPSPSAVVSLFTHLVDTSMTSILARNETDQTIEIP